jgi:hypothetical protein
MGRVACTELQCLYKGALYFLLYYILLPYLSNNYMCACMRVHTHTRAHAHTHARARAHTHTRVHTHTHTHPHTHTHTLAVWNLRWSGQFWNESNLFPSHNLVSGLNHAQRTFPLRYVSVGEGGRGSLFCLPLPQ